MSYSYIKSVFPNFESSTNFDVKVYSPPEHTLKPKASQQTSIPVAYDEQEYKQFAQQLVVEQPVVSITEKPLRSMKETFQSTEQEGKLVCDDYLKHALNCSSCRATLVRQLGVDADKARNEEFMELLSYVIFGLFMLMLIDNSKSL